MNSEYKIISQENGFKIIFTAFASDCEIIIKTTDIIIAKNIANIAYTEALRIQNKYSRYSKNNIIYQINQGQKTYLDDETHNLFNFAKTAYEASNGKFDITSGVLRKIWKFSNNSIPPTKQQIKNILPYIGFNKIIFENNIVQLPKGMEIDFGGFGKEYAVDKVFNIINNSYNLPFMINFGGDLRVNKPPSINEYWHIDIANNSNNNFSTFFKLQVGAIATSGNTYRYIYHSGKKLSHILNPNTGSPVKNSPNSISVSANTCIDAGFLSTLALMEGRNAERFLKHQNNIFFIQ